MSRESLLDEAIVKAKEAEDWQLVEWLRMARGGESAARWYTAKLSEARLDISNLMTENAKLREQVERLRTQLADMTESVGRVEERCAKTFEVGKRWMAKAARFEAENTKLRELISGLEHCCQGYVCDCCPLYDQSGTNHHRCESLERELGIEVDG